MCTFIAILVAPLGVRMEGWQDRGPRAVHPRAVGKFVSSISALYDTTEWWEAWSAQCTHEGPWGEAVLRSLITPKAMTDAPTGGMVAWNLSRSPGPADIRPKS